MDSELGQLLKISELSHESGFPVSTIRHYINEGLLFAVKKSKNMAYYDRQDIPRIHLVKKLQDELFLPLQVIKKLLSCNGDLSFEEYDLFVEVRNRLEEQINLLPDIGSIPLGHILDNLKVSENEIKTMETMKIINSEIHDGQKYFNEMDYRIIKAASDVRSLGFSQDIGFSADDFNIYLGMIRNLVHVETSLFIKRVSGNRSAGEIAELIGKGLPAINNVIAALHQKFALEALTQRLFEEKKRRQEQN